MIVAGTGHRPSKLGGYGPEVFWRLVRLARSYLETVEPFHVISGMALGWDQALAMAALELSIPFTAACPFEDMHVKWPNSSRLHFLHLFEAAQEVVFVNPGEYAVWKMQARNEWMVDRADRMATLWDGSTGGTKNCLDYAAKVKPDMPIDNLWAEWEAMCN